MKLVLWEANFKIMCSLIKSTQSNLIEHCFQWDNFNTMHQTSKPVMISCELNSRRGKLYFLLLLKPLDVNFVQKCKICLICENLQCCGQVDPGHFRETSKYFKFNKTVNYNWERTNLSIIS